MMDHAKDQTRDGRPAAQGKRTGTDGKNHVIEYSLKLDSNPEFNGSVLTAFARAIAKRAANGVTGAFTVFDIAPGLLSPKDPADLRAHLL